jgi:hypothetical protein
MCFVFLPVHFETKGNLMRILLLASAEQGAAVD